MKILILIKTSIGGPGRVITSIKSILEKKGHKVEIILREDDLKIYSLFGSAKPLREAISKKDFEILYTQDWSCALPFLFMKNHYCCFHGLNPSKTGRILQKIVGKVMGKRLFVVSDFLHKKFPKSTILYNGVDKKQFHDMKKKRKYFGWIKRDYEEKNEEEIRTMAKNYGLKLSIANKIPQDKMNEWYNSLKVFVSYPKSFSGFNMCWLEAKASGVPNILGNNNGIGIENIHKNFHKFTWENNVNKFLEVLNEQGIN